MTISVAMWFDYKMSPNRFFLVECLIINNLVTLPWEVLETLRHGSWLKEIEHNLLSCMHFVPGHWESLLQLLTFPQKDWGNLWGHWQWEQDLSLVLELTFWSPFSWEKHLAQQRYRGEGLGPASKWCGRFGWLSIGSLTISEKWMRGGMDGRWAKFWGGEEDGPEIGM